MNDFLAHYGILGMKWGRRKSVPSADHAKAQGLKKKKISEMSNEELRILTTRIQLERQYKSLNPGKISNGKRIVSNIITNVGQITATAAAITSAYKLGKKIYQNLTGNLVAGKFK